MRYHYVIYKTTHVNGKYYIGRHQTTNLDDGYLGSGNWVKKIKDTSTLSREILVEARTTEDLFYLEEHFIKIHYDDPLCMNIKHGSNGYISEDVAGKNHPKYDHTVYELIHSNGDYFIGAQHEFRRQFSINSGQMSRLLNGTLLSAKGWRLLSNNESPVLSRRRKIHRFINKNGQEFVGTRSKFIIKYPEIKRQYVDALISGKSKSALGWILSDSLAGQFKLNNFDRIYHFINKSDQEFIGTSLDFRKKHNINQGNLSRLIRGDRKVKTIKGWSLNVMENECLD